jgi:hypothetical protein
MKARKKEECKGCSNWGKGDLCNASGNWRPAKYITKNNGRCKPETKGE